MSASPGLRFLRPYLCKDLAVSQKNAYLRFFSSSRRLEKKAFQTVSSYGHDVAEDKENLKRNTNDRITKLEKANALNWPRIQNDKKSMTLGDYNTKYESLEFGQRIQSENVLVRGMELSEKSLRLVLTLF